MIGDNQKNGIVLSKVSMSSWATFKLLTDQLKHIGVALFEHGK